MARDSKGITQFYPPSQPQETYLPLLRKHSPDGATPTEVADI